MAATNSDTGIANRALLAIGQTQLLSDLSTDTSTVANTIKLVYQDCVDTVLQSGDWNMNAGRATLSRFGTDPLFDFPYQYALPSDCLNVRELYDAGGVLVSCANDPNGFGQERWRVETVGEEEASMTKVLVCDLGSPIKIVYGRMLNSLARWTPMTREVLVARVAMLIAMPITQKASTAEAARKTYEDTLAMALMRDAQEGSATLLDTGTWVQARL